MPANNYIRCAVILLVVNAERDATSAWMRTLYVLRATCLLFILPVVH